MRARHPDIVGHLERDGVTLGFEVFGQELAASRPTVVLMPTWTIVHARTWKLQVPYLARHYRVIVYDGPGNGRSERTTDPTRYTFDAYAADAAAVLDECGVERAVVVGLSLGSPYALRLAGIRPDLVAGLVLIGGALPLAQLPERGSIAERFLDPAPESPSGWDRYNRAYWNAHYREFAQWFFEQVFSEPHSTKAREDAVGWALESGPELIGAEALKPASAVEGAGLLEGLSCPVLFVHGTEDRVQPHAASERAAHIAGAPLVSFVGAGHAPNVRDPVRFNLLLRDFVERVTT